MEVSPDARVRRRVIPLLLLHLFVANTAADCPKPQASSDIVLTDETLLKNNFPEGCTVTLECANGYVYESGSGTMTCTAGNWGDPDLICRKKDCGPPKPQPHMRFDTSAGTLFGAVVRAFCDKGYEISGSSYKQCFAIGWTGRAKCEIVNCEPPGKVANGRSSWDSQEYPRYGEIIYYFCNKGYTIVGKNYIVCGETGEYDYSPPECKGVTTEATVTTKMVTPTSTPPAPELSTATVSSATPTAHRDKPVATSAAPTVSLWTQELSTATVSSATPTAHRDKPVATSAAPTVSLWTQELSTATVSSATPTAHRDKPVATSAAPTVSLWTQELSTATVSSATPTAHRDKPVATSAAPTVSLWTQGGILDREDTTTGVTSTTSFQDKHDGAVDTSKDIGHAPVIVSVICILLVVLVLVFIHKCLLKRKGCAEVPRSTL